MTSGELEDFIRQVVTSGTLLELGSEGGSSQKPQELLRSTMTSNTTSLDKFLTALGEGQYDTTVPKSKVSECHVFSSAIAMLYSWKLLRSKFLHFILTVSISYGISTCTCIGYSYLLDSFPLTIVTVAMIFFFGK